MSSVSTPRVIGKYSGTSPGPLLICLAGIHGNEPAGVHALGKLFEELEADNTSIRGTIIGIAGNCAALNVSQRFIDRDLNRAWQSEPPQQYDNSHEAAEKKEIVGLLQELLDGYSGSAFFLDLHTSSAGGAPFSCIGDTIRNRKFGRSFPTPKILGLEEQIDGALLEFLNNLGLTTMGFEGGQHQDLDAIDNCRAAIWCGMVGAGCISAKHHLAKSAYDLLAERTKGSPPWVGIRYRHAIAECDEFKMRPGLQNFDRVEANYLLATHNSEAVHSFYKARVILPLYQGQGDDGFFLANEIKPVWLVVSRWLRFCKVDKVAHWLPGVKRCDNDRECLEVNPGVARWLVVEIFHLLGFRKRRYRENKLIFSRRKYDTRPPQKIQLR